MTVIRGTISAGSNFGVGRSHEPKYPAARKRPFCGLCTASELLAASDIRCTSCYTRHFRYTRGCNVGFQRFCRPCSVLIVIPPRERATERERERTFRRSRRYSSFGISVRPSRIRRLILVERLRLRRFSAVRKTDRIKFLSQVDFPIAVALTLEQAN